MVVMVSINFLFPRSKIELKKVNYNRQPPTTKCWLCVNAPWVDNWPRHLYLGNIGPYMVFGLEKNPDNVGGSKSEVG